MNIPALIIAANKDLLTRPDASEFIHRNIKSSELFTASPAGHQGLVERHAEVNEAVKKFIKGLKEEPKNEAPIAL
jgi:pimeloyl-ACP methyl ester carboxylesterase